jgi:DNA polymerase-3 subunit gamma/tau
MSAEPTTTPYRVLARKYRPTTFEEVIGQEALIRTLTNAIAGGRIAHAFMLTGVRGVGKTTTARLIARALNCVGPDGNGGPTIKPCGVCDQCKSIAEDRHVDVVEMDAASRTGIDDIRELIEGVRYHPVSARNKIYIIDEVHMLSKPAFNALLKTLEEPPEHVHFIFATTEVRKVPVTVLSRCQRFDLRRVNGEELARYFQQIAEKESVDIGEEAVALIAHAADGSVRDGLSLFDQAITLGDSKVSTELVRDMLGLADRTQIFDLFDHVMAGRTADALDLFARMYRDGVDPVTVMQDLLEVTHWLTRLSIVPEIVEAPGTPETERTRGLAMSKTLPISVLSRVWQMLLKGLGEVQSAPSPRQAGEMILIRLAYVADFPTPAEFIRESLDQNPSHRDSNDADLFSAPDAPSTSPAPPVTSATPTATLMQTDAVQTFDGGQQAALAAPISDPMPADVPESVDDEVLADAEPEGGVPETTVQAGIVNTFDDLVTLFSEKRELMLQAQLYNNVHLVSFESGRLEIRPNEHAQPSLASRVSSLLSEWTGMRWIVTISAEPGSPTLAEQEMAAERGRWESATRHPLVRAVTDAFPGAEITRVTTLTDDAAKSQQEDLRSDNQIPGIETTDGEVPDSQTIDQKDDV